LGGNIWVVNVWCGVLVERAFTIYYEAWVIELARAHFAATVGSPFAALAALCLVVILEINIGKIEIKVSDFILKERGPIDHVDILLHLYCRRNQASLVIGWQADGFCWLSIGQDSRPRQPP
jgi:hypothetical protein